MITFKRTDYIYFKALMYIILTMVEPKPKCQSIVMDLKIKSVVGGGDQGYFQYMPNQMRLLFLDAVKQYFTTIYLFISILYFVLGYYAFRFTL